MEMTLGEAFARSARKFPNKWACKDDEKRLTYDQLNRRVNRWVPGLAGYGPRPRGGIWPPCPTIASL